jgi:hypothetical protein
LVAPGLSSRCSQWLKDAGKGIRLPHEHLSIPPWKPEELLQIIDVGSENLGIDFDSDLLNWMIKVSCGLPATMTLLAALSSQQANNGNDNIKEGTVLRVGLSCLDGLLGEGQRFSDTLYDFDRDKIRNLSVSALFALYLLGINKGSLSEKNICQYLEQNGFAFSGILDELEGLIFVEKRQEIVYWTINELSNGTFSFLRLYYRSKLHVDDADKIATALKQIHRASLLIQGTRPARDSKGKRVSQITGEDDMISILFLSADPTDESRLRLGQEFREIQEELWQAKHRQKFRLELPQLSARSGDVSGALLNLEPTIVHFSGHGAADGTLCFEDAIGKAQPVNPDALAALFEQFANSVQCVVLNACYAEIQAKAIAQHIDYVIGMNEAISDKAAIAFSIGFYQALGAGRDIEAAFKMGCVQIQLHNIPEHLTPVLIKGKKD